MNRKTVKIFSKKRKTKTLKYYGGGCETIPEKIIEFRDSVILTCWTQNPNRWRKTKYKRKRGATEENHPIIDDLIRQGYTLETALSFYCGKTRIGVPEYQTIISRLDDYNFVAATAEDLAKERGESILAPWKDYYALCIKRIGDEYNSGNILQPALWQIFILQYYIDHYLYAKMNNLKNPALNFSEKWNEYLELFDPTYNKDREDSYTYLDFDILGGHSDDLDIRTDLIVEIIHRKYGIGSVHIIDGHGRFVRRLMRKFIGERESERELDLFVYDVDEESHLWHELTLPFGCAKNEDILNELEMSLGDGSINTKFFYLNFSGLGGQGRRIRKLLTLLFTTYHEYIEHVVVSFSHAQAGRKPAKKLKDKLLSLHTKYLFNYTHQFVLLTDREDFFTIGAVPSFG